MGVFAGPDVSESGLVLAVDGANIKSFKGEATTNELVAITWGGDGTAQAGMSFGSTAVTEEYLKYKGYETYLWSPGSSLNCYLNGADVDVNRTSTVWTFSCYVKREDGAAITSLNVYMYYPSSDGSAAGTIEDVGNGWYRVSRTRTGTSSNITLAGFTGFVAGYKYYLSGAQLEKKSYATTPATVNTTRGTTVATGGGWADISGTGNNGELVNGVRENSNNLGSLLFDGTDDYISCGDPSTLNFGTGNFSLCFTTYTTAYGFQGGSYVGKGDGTSIGFDFRDGAFFVYGTSGLIAQISFSATLNVWEHHTFVFNRSSSPYITYYKNGTLSSTSTTNNSANISSSISTTQPFRIGLSVAGGPTRYFNGRIASVSVYNRALTAAEIQQNFNATRGRFGI